MNSTRLPGETTSSDGVRTPAAEMIIWFGLSTGEGLLPPEPPHVPAAAASAKTTSRRAGRTLELDSERDGKGTVLRRDAVGLVLVDVFQAMRVAAVDHQRSVLEAAADRHPEIQPLHIVRDVDFLGGAAKLGARPGAQPERRRGS